LLGERHVGTGQPDCNGQHALLANILANKM
jgi:hypothetical protein